MEIEKRGGKEEKADMYCGCLMTAKEEERKNRKAQRRRQAEGAQTE